MSWRVVMVSSNSKVDYKLDYLVVRSVDKTSRIHLSEISVLVIESTAVSILSLKSTQWSYEGEWRTFFQKNPPSHKETMPVAHSVTLGAKIDRTNEEKIRRICNAKGISVFKIKADLKAGKLLIE